MTKAEIKKRIEKLTKEADTFEKMMETNADPDLEEQYEDTVRTINHLADMYYEIED